MDSARRTLSRGTGFFGPKEIESVFGASLAPGPNDVPPLPSEWEIDRAKELGHRLILCWPVTMARVDEILGGQLGSGKPLFNKTWCRAEAFYEKLATVRWHWRFTGEDVIEDTPGQNYLSQTRTLVKYLQEQVSDDLLLPKLYTDAVEESKREEEGIAKLMTSKDWPEAAKRLAALRVNQLCREAPDQVLWDVILNQKVNGIYVLPGMYAWTNTLSLVGSLVCVGNADPDGVRLGGNGPRTANDRLGARFSRSVLPLAG